MLPLNPSLCYHTHNAISSGGYVFLSELKMVCYEKKYVIRVYLRECAWTTHLYAHDGDAIVHTVEEAEEKSEADSKRIISIQ